MADDNLERITILLQAKDREFARAMDRSNKLIARLTRDAERGTTRMSRTVQKNLSAMTSSVSSFAVGFAGGIAGGLVTGAIDKLTTGLADTVKGIASIGDEARRAGLGVEAFQEWKFVAEQNRIGIDQLVDGFKELNLRADELVQTGAGPAAESFARLGYTSADLAKKLKDPSALMLEIIGRMEGMDKAAQIRIADEVFGGSAGERFVELLAQGDEGLRRMIDRAHELGIVLDEQMIAKAQDLDRRWNELTTSVGTFFKVVSVGAADAVAGLVGLKSEVDSILEDEARARILLGNTVYDRVKDAGQLTGEIENVVSQIASGIDAIIPVADQMASAFSQISENLKTSNPQLSADLADAARNMEALIFQLENGMIDADEFRDKMSDLVSDAKLATDELIKIDGVGFASVQSGLAALARMLEFVAQKAAAARAAMPAGVTTGTPMGVGDIQLPPTESAPRTSPKPKAAPSGFAVDMDGNGVPDTVDDARKKAVGGGKSKGGGGGKDRFGDSMKDWRVEVEGMLAEAEALNSLVLAYDEYGISVDVARKKAELLQEAKEAGKTITPQLRAEIDALAESYANASLELERAKQRHDEFKDAVEEARGTLSSTFTGLTTGALSFSDALGNVIGKLAEMLAMKGFEALWGAGLGNATGGFLKMLGFSSGGYTGAGGRNQPAGIVHKGEVVFSQDDVARAGGVAAVEAMRRNGVSRAVPARQSPPAAMGGMDVSIGWDDSIGNFRATVRDEAGRVVAQATPGMVGQAVAATYRRAQEVPIG